MHTRQVLFATFVAFVFVSHVACSGSEGECTYDTDCPGECQICDTSSHECVDDPVCQSMIQGNCASDQDCDPLYEKCVSGKCVAVYDGGDPGPSDGDTPPADGDSGGDEIPEVCLNPDLDCTVPQTETEVSQGRDRDHDDWGECCDCDDQNAAVNPSRIESVYNCKDDDCNPDTPDDDLDRDGYGSILRGCDPGSDCNDSRADINPGATEICDGVDNNCSGEIDAVDGESVCGQQECADISGPHHLEPHCLAFDEEDIDIGQDGCNVSFTANEGEADEFTCTGELDPMLNLYIECAGLMMQCTAKVSLTQTWRIDCSDTCWFFMYRISDFTDCVHYSDPACTANGQRCGVDCDVDDARKVCVNTIPGGRQPGYFCDPANSIDCANEFCHNGFCTSACRSESDCDGFTGTTCQSIAYDGCTNIANFNACVPAVGGETSCHRSSDCDPSSDRICTYRKEADDVARVCRLPSGSANAGESCNSDADCKSGFCVCGTSLCAGSSGKCSEVCAGASDCPAGAECGLVAVPDEGGTDHDIPACVWTGGTCGRDSDCPPETPVCTVGVSGDGQSLTTFCTGKNETFEDPNPGVECSSMWQCWSYWCLDFYNPGFCAAVCSSDGDCPAFDGDKTCGTDADCPLGFLCDGSDCMRNFQCRAQVFAVGAGVDAVDMCLPERRQCFLDDDCRAGEACKLDYNSDATAALYLCEKEGPGTSTLGDSCWPDGPSACYNGLCLLEDGGGEGKQYCSKACLEDDDCIDPVTYRCAAITVQTPFGFSQAPACVKR